MALTVRVKGYMLKQSASHLTKKWQRRWFVLHNTSSEGVVRIEYYDDEEGEMVGANKRTILLRGIGDCRQLTGDKSRPYVFEVTSQIGCHVFSCESWDEMESWMEGIRAAVEEDKAKGTKKKGVSSTPSAMDPIQPRNPLGRPDATELTSQLKAPNLQPEERDTPAKLSAMESSKLKPTTEPSRSQLQQNPLLLNTSAQFPITIKPSKDAKRLGLTGQYNLELTHTHVRLLNISGTVPITGWSYQELKRFSLDKGCVEIECGHVSGNSAGKFIFITPDAAQIVKEMQHHIEEQLAENRRASSQSTPSKASIDNDFAPLKPKCSTESPPLFKKLHPDHKTVVENDYGTSQDLMRSPEVSPTPADVKQAGLDITRNTSTDALLSDMDTVETSEISSPVNTSVGLRGNAAKPLSHSVPTEGASLTASDFKFSGPGTGYRHANATSSVTPTVGAATGYTPAVPVGAATGYSPAVPVGVATGYTPAVPVVAATGYSPAIPVGAATGHSPAIPIGAATGYTPAIQVGAATGYTPAIQVGAATGHSTAVPVGAATGYTPAMPVGTAAGHSPAILAGASSSKPAITVGLTGSKTASQEATKENSTGVSMGAIGYTPVAPVVATNPALSTAIETTGSKVPGYAPANIFMKAEDKGEVFPVTVKQNKAAKLCGLNDGSYNIEITATHFRLLEPMSPIPIMGWTFQDLKAFSVEKDSIVIEVGDLPGIVGGRYVFYTKSSKELFRAIQQSIQLQLRGQRVERWATLERSKMYSSRPLPNPLEDSQDDEECLLGSTGDAGGRKESSEQGPIVSTGPKDYLGSIKQGTAGITEARQPTTAAVAVHSGDSAKVASTAGLTSAQTAVIIASPGLNGVGQASAATSSAVGQKGTLQRSGTLQNKNETATKVFSVTLKQNKVAKIFGLTGVYNLEVAPSFVRVVDQTTSAAIMTWTLAELQSFSLGKDSIDISIGKASGIGAGTYVFKTKQCKEVFRAVEQSIHKLLHDTKNKTVSPPPPPPRPSEAQQMAFPVKEVTEGKPTNKSQATGHKGAAVENVYDASPRGGCTPSDGRDSLDLEKAKTMHASGNISQNKDFLEDEASGSDEDGDHHHMTVAGHIDDTHSDAPESTGARYSQEQNIELCTVTLKQNKSATSAGLVGTYNLELTPTEVRLTEINQTVPVVIWTYQEIKTFTKGKNFITLEVGRRAQTGPGEFVFNTKCAEEVYKVIEYNVEQQLRDETIGQEVRKRIQAQPLHHTGASKGNHIRPTETFLVTLKSNKLTASLGLVGTYNLEVTPTEIRLTDINQTTPIVVWVYQQIRSFTKGSDVFSIEVGIKSQTGEGEFVLNTNSAEELYQAVEYHVERQLRDETIGQEARNRVRTQPIHRTSTETPLFKDQGQHDGGVVAGVAGKYRPINTDLPQSLPVTTSKQSTDQSRNYHHLDDSLPLNNGPQKDDTLESVWENVDANTNPYGEVQHHAFPMNSDAMRTQQDIGALQGTTGHSINSDSTPLLLSAEGDIRQGSSPVYSVSKKATS